MASRKLNSTPPSMISRRFHAALLRNSHGLAGCFMASVFIDSSIMPAMEQ